MRRLRIAIGAALLLVAVPLSASAQVCTTLDLGGGISSTNCSGPGMGSSTSTNFDLGGGITGSSINGTTEYGTPFYGTGSSYSSGGISSGSYSCYDYTHGRYVPCR